METVPNRKKPLFAGKGQLLVSSPRNCTCRCAVTVAYREMGTWSNGVEVGPPSNVTIRVKVVTNPGRSFVAAFGQAVPRWLRGVLKAEDWESRSSRSGKLPCRGLQTSVLQGSGRLVPVFGWHQAQSGRRKNGRVKPNVSSVHYWS